MKSILLTMILICFTAHAFAQDTVKAVGPELVERTNDTSLGLHEKYTVLKTDKKVKHGLFQAFYNGKTLVASGKYDNGKQVGAWRYCEANGKVNQVYSYTNKKLIYNQKPDTAFAEFDFDGKINPTDTLTHPVKIGGLMYGYWFVINASVKQFSTDMRNMGIKTPVRCINILNINADGILTRWQLVAINGDFKKKYEVPIDKLTDFDKLFVAATQNGKNIASVAYIKTYTTFYSGID